MPKYAGLRALLGRCMEGVDDPFSDEGEHVVYMRFYAAAQIALTDYLNGLIEGQAAPEVYSKLKMLPKSRRCRSRNDAVTDRHGFVPRV